MEEGRQKKSNYHDESGMEKQMTVRHCPTEEEKSARICSPLQIHVIGSTAAPLFFHPSSDPLRWKNGSSVWKLTLRARTALLYFKDVPWKIILLLSPAW